MQFTNGMTLGAFSVVFNILLALFVFAYFYDRWITNLGARAEGWAWLQVIGGVFVNLIAIGLLDFILPWNAFLIGLMTFAVSGTPMSVGAWRRHQEAQSRARKAMLQE